MPKPINRIYVTLAIDYEKVDVHTIATKAAQMAYGIDGVRDCNVGVMHAENGAIVFIDKQYARPEMFGIEDRGMPLLVMQTEGVAPCNTCHCWVATAFTVDGVCTEYYKEAHGYYPGDGPRVSVPQLRGWEANIPALHRLDAGFLPPKKQI